ncbi:MAG: hypothetical protein N2512_13990 [Armatimonadetes bacterium]|nr:hypothetical protein [Armatimonadota bacterium]
MGYEQRTEPPEYTRIAEKAKEILLRYEDQDPAMSRALAMKHVVEHAPVTLERDALLVGGEDPFLFNLMLPALQADRHSRVGQTPPTEACGRLRDAGVYIAACFEGHITPGLDDILSQGVTGIRARIEERLAALGRSGADDPPRRAFYQAALISCDNILTYARRYREATLALAEQTDDEAWAADLRESAEVLSVVPEFPAQTFRQALQAYWLGYILVTVEMGGCCPGGGLGLGRPDQYLLPYYRRDIERGVLTRAQALELLEIFLLNFRHVDYYTWHQPATPGSHGSLGGVTPAGVDASNELTELIMEASLRIAMPAPYLSVRLHREAPERYWELAANYVIGGLGFPIVNDEVLVPAMIKHGRSLEDARDYICSCCYENTVPGREAFHPNASYLNLPLVLEMALNEGRSLLAGQQLGLATPPPDQMRSMEDVRRAFLAQLGYVADRLVELVNSVDQSHCENRRYPMMSLFIDDCIARGVDVCAGGAHYNLTGCIVSGLPNVVNSLAAIERCVFEDGAATMGELVEALRSNFSGAEDLRRRLLRAPKWGNGDETVDRHARWVTEELYRAFHYRTNPRGGRWQLALYSFVANLHLGKFVGAGADGRLAGQPYTRNLDPAWGTDRNGPTGVLRSLSAIDFTCFPNGSVVDLTFDPAALTTPSGRAKFAAFLKAFVDLGVMAMQVSMVDRETLLEAQREPHRFPHLLVKVAGFSARFVDLSPEEQTEVINRTVHR